MAYSLSYGLAYADFLNMTLFEVEAFRCRVSEVREVNNYSLAVKVGQLFSKEGLKPPTFNQKSSNYAKYSTDIKPVDARTLSDNEKQRYIDQIMNYQAIQSQKNEEVLRG